MKWIVGALILAVVASLVSGRVPATWVIYCFAALFASLGGALFFAYSRSQHYGLFLMGIAYFAAALGAVVLSHWWPLVVGFGAVWVMRLMGMDPKPDDMPGASAQPGEGDKKT